VRRCLRALAVASLQSKATGENVESVTSRFNGLFWTSFQVGTVPQAALRQSPRCTLVGATTPLSGLQFNGACGLIISSIIFQTVPNASEAAKWMFTAFGVLCSIGVCILFFAPAISVQPSSVAPGSLNESLTENESESTALKASSGLTDPGEEEAGVPPKAATEAAAASVSLYETVKLFWSSRAMQVRLARTCSPPPNNAPN
jgi:hypothetical protein